MRENGRQDHRRGAMQELRRINKETKPWRDNIFTRESGDEVYAMKQYLAKRASLSELIRAFMNTGKSKKQKESSAGLCDR